MVCFKKLEDCLFKETVELICGSHFVRECRWPWVATRVSSSPTAYVHDWLMLLNNLVQSYWTNVQCNSVTGRLMWDYPFNNFFFIKVALCAKNLYISFKCIGILPRLLQAKLLCFLPFMLSCNINVSCKYIIFPNKANLKCYIFQYFL